MPWDPFANIPRIADAVENAPSVFNTRPWRLDISAADRIDLRLRADLANLDEGIPRERACKREYVISCGATLFNLRLVMRVAGHDVAVWLLPDPQRDRGLLASVEIVTGRIEKPTIAEQELYEAIWQRHTNRSPYKILPAPIPIIVEMERAAAKEDAWLRLLNHHQARKWMRLVARVDRDPAFTPPFPNLVPPANYGPPPQNPLPLENPLPRTRKDFWRDNEKQRFEFHPRLMALSTDDDQPPDWLHAGQALQHAILTASRYSVSAPHGLTARYHAPPRLGVPARHHLLKHDDLAHYGLSVSFLTQPLERDDIRAKPRQWPWRWRFPELPQMVMRVGYAPSQPPAAPLEKEPHIRDARPSRPGAPSPGPDSEPGN